MYGSTILNIKLSLAILSGLGFMGILVLAPVTPINYKQKYIQKKNDIIPLKSIEEDTRGIVSVQPQYQGKDFSLNRQGRNNSQNNSNQTQDLRTSIDPSFKTMDMYYRTSSDFSASFKSSRFDIFDDINFFPSQNNVIQNLIYNSNRSYIHETSLAEGVRLALAVELQYFIFNIKYNYLSDSLMRNTYRYDVASAFNKDYATVGFTFYLDRYKRYSIYLGHNYYNIASQNRPIDSIAGVSNNNSFSASFRGRSSEYYNSSFFFNFKNNTNRDFYYSSFGVFRLPIASHLISEYATSLGLELSF
ncbi:MAG: hypothetical protein KBA66_01085 [Leptospiraceae bacterium]|nr:hypothetical protein [Leptospiraceae bacterium]